MTAFSFSSLRVRLVLLVLLAVLPALGLVLYTGLAQRRHEAADAQERALELARLAGDEQRHLGEVARQLLTTLAQLSQVRGGGDPVACNSLMVHLSREYGGYTGLGVARPDGEIVCSSLPVPRPFNVAGQAYFQRALQTRSFAVGDYQIGRLSGKPVLIFAYPILKKRNTVQAVLSLSLDLAWLNQFAAEAQLPPGSTITVMDRRGTILARAPDPGQWVGRSVSEAPIVQHILSHPGEGTTEAVGVDGILRLYGFTTLTLPTVQEGAGAYVSVGIPADVAFAEPNRVLVSNLMLLGLVAVLALAAAWIGGGLAVVQPVQALLKATQRLSAGDLSARSGLPAGPGEFNHLTRAFDEMAETLERDRAARQRAEEALVARTKQLEAIRAVTIEITRELALPTLLDVITRRAADLVEAVSGAVFLWDETAEVLIPHAWHGMGGWMREARLRLGEGVAGTVASLRQGMVVNDFQRFPNIHPLFKGQSGITAVVAEPLLHHERLLGVIAISNQGTGRPFTEQDRNTLSLFAAEAAIAIEKARLYEAIRLHAATLEQRVQERTRELALANEQLAAASRHKSEFLANMSHELRTPLNSVIGFAELLQGQVVGPLTEKQARYLGHIHTSGKHLLQLISDILDLSKVEAGKFDLQPQALPVAQTLEDILVIVRGLANKKAQTVESDIQDDLPSLHADPLRFKQILFNLLSNAVKFTPEKGTISVTARRLEGAAVLPSGGAAVGLKQPQHGNTAGPQHWLEMRVTDTGVGIKAEDLPRLFQEFVQLEATQAQRHEGTGLGLALTKRLVTLHGGRIWADSKGEGQGSAFTFVLPFDGPEA